MPRRSSVSRLGPHLALLVAAGLAGCNGAGFESGSPTAGPGGNPVPPAPSRVAVLLPLSGPNASVGDSMLDAIRLAFSAHPEVLDVSDTRGTPDGATSAAQAAIDRHDGIVLGPLTSAEARAAGAVAVPAGIPVLAFTSDPAVAQPGLWVLGITPDQQVSRLVEAARADGRGKPAAFLPQTPLGDAMAGALVTAAAAQGLPAPDIRRHDDAPGSIADGLKSLSDIDSRRATQAAAAPPPPAGTTPATPHATPDPGSPAALLSAPPDPATPAPASPSTTPGQPAAATPPATAAAATPPAPPPPPAPLPPPAFDMLLLADTGTALQLVIDGLAADGLDHAHEVRVLGPGLWNAFVRKLGHLHGAWYAAPDPAARAGFVRDYLARTHRMPKALDDFAFDSAALAALLDAGGGISNDALTRAQGFSGTDGAFALLPDGHVRRALAVFQIDAGGGSHIVSPAPARFGGAPGGA